MTDTKLICPVCGTSMELPEHQSVSCGVSLAKDSGLGNIYLTPEKEKRKVTKVEERLETMKSAGIDVSNFAIFSNANGEQFLFKNENGILSPVPEIEEDKNDPIVAAIKESGYVFNRYTNPRWITAKMFKMLNYKNYKGETGYERALDDKGYWYMFKFLLTSKRDGNSRFYVMKNDGELHRLARMERQNDPELSIRGRYFNAETVALICDDYMNHLIGYINSLPVRMMEGKIPYKRIRGIRGLDGKGDVTLSKMDATVYNPLRVSISRIRRAKTYVELERAFSHFRSLIIPFPTYGKSKTIKQPDVFRSKYKGLGAYYTCDNLIKFHGCIVHDNFGKTDTERSLAILYDEATKHNENGEDWKLFYFMKKLISDNNFVPDWNN